MGFTRVKEIESDSLEWLRDAVASLKGGGIRQHLAGGVGQQIHAFPDDAALLKQTMPILAEGR